eukprot:CAMPEP_0195519310 /NCGR_PEP_ID=MMETSP0794_2-20130614/14573_1 /TAXON_ID=515487 /ORGANISM="Stephanopyxis turris, Strain CCMP 815" /LENGTH=273 /DNA_ID=CAMNT_0040648435 /DNA_START=188 /DNA_END=1009 /DNA_ORIENTATION=-
MKLSKAADDLVSKLNFPSAMERKSEIQAMKNAHIESRFGLYGEYPFLSLSTILQQPAVTEAMNRNAAVPPTFVDIGSGPGRLMLGASVMANWTSVYGLEGRPELHNNAIDAIRSLEREGTLREGMVHSVSGDFMEESPEVINALSGADVIFAYSTCFENHGDIRLPALSALLARHLKKGSVVIVVDKFLVGERFQYDSLYPMQDVDTGEPTVSIVWRVLGEPSRRSLNAEIDTLYNSDSMNVNVCEKQPKACEELKTKQLSLFGFESMTTGAW